MPETNYPKRYYPKLSEIITIEDLPEFLSFVQDGLNAIFEKIHYKNLQYSKSFRGDAAFYSLDIVTRKPIKLALPFDMALVLNPDMDGDNNISSFPITLEYQWEILAFLKTFSLEGFSFSLEDFYQTGLKIFRLTEDQVLAHTLNYFVEDPLNGETKYQSVVDEVNALYSGQSGYVPIVLPTGEEITVSIVTQLISQHVTDRSVSMVMFAIYILDSDMDVTSQRLREFYNIMVPEGIETYIKKLITPSARATLALSAAIEFPPNILKPVDASGVVIEGQTTKFLFAQAQLYADTQAGIGYQLELAGSLVPNFAAIGNTGLILQIVSLKMDLSKESNIPEADLDGRPSDFVGVYARAISVTFPPKWFHDDEEPQGNSSTTLRLGAYDLLIGTGGVSGTIMLESVPIVNEGVGFEYYNDKFTFDYPITMFGKYPESDEIIEIQINTYQELKIYLQELNSISNAPYPFKFPLSLKPLGSSTSLTFDSAPTYQRYLFGLEENTLWKKIGGENGFRVGFTSFDITFKQNSVTSSNIAGKLIIPKFKDSLGNDAEIIITGHLNEAGDFNLTASEPDGIPLSLFDFITFNFLSLELGRQDDDFYIGTSCEIWFENETMNKILKNQKIQVPNIRIYSNGKFEFVGGNGFIPTNVSLDLGPIEVAVTGIHFGSQEYNGILYNYWGFDGAISLNPLGLDARGEGIKYYYPADGESGDSFLRIQTIEVDLVIPGSADPESALVIIHGMLSIPQPGETQEYVGEISIDLPQLKVSGGAAMKLQPKPPAFIIDAYVNLPGPIPIGPVGIYGFRGLLGFRYVAEKEAVGMTSGQNSWYDYYVYPPKGIHVTKFTGPERTKDYDPAFSLGVGATLGTSFDNGMIVSLRAMVLFSFPTAMILDFGLTFISKRLGLIEDDPRNPPFFAFIALGDNSLEFGLGADFQLPDNGWILDLQARIEAGFFFKNQRPWYVNFGTREIPVTATLFKDLLNITVTSFLMISAQGIEAGARAQFELNWNFAGIRVYIFAYIEVGGHVSFKRPQTGGFMYAGGAIKADIWRIVVVEVALDTAFSVEAIKPFLLYAALQLRVRVKLLFIKIKIDVKLELKWEKEKKINRDPFSRLPQNNENADVGVESSRVEELVKGVHMLTNETFDLQYFSSVPSAGSISKVIPMDTFIDIKFIKGVDPSLVSGSGMIGGHTGGADNFQDLIPPKKVVKGKELRQVTHKHTIEEISIKIHNGSQWVDYNPFDAIAEDEANVDDLRFGFWQRKGKQYDHLRILATSPFSYLSSGQPGWIIPEEYGITASELFCVEESLSPECSNFMEKQIGDKYYVPADVGSAHYIDGAYYVLAGGNPIIINDDYTYYLTNEEYFEIKPSVNPHGFSKSLSFRNYNKLWVILPAPSVSVKLKLTTEAKSVKVSYYAANIPDDNSSNTSFSLIGAPVTYLRSELQNPVEFESEGTLISRVLIEPEVENMAEIRAVLEAIEEYIYEGYQSGAINDPGFYNTIEYLNLLSQLEILQSVGCAGNSNSTENDKKKICDTYNEFLNRYWNCLSTPLTYSDREGQTQKFIRYAEFIVNHLPCYSSLLTYMQNFVSSLDASYYFESDIVNFQTKLVALQLVCNNATSDGNITYPTEYNAIKEKHDDLLAVYEIFLNKLRQLKDCTTVARVCTKVNQLEAALLNCLPGNINYVNCYQTLRTELNSFLTGFTQFRDVLTYLLDEQTAYFSYHAMLLVDADTLKVMFSENARDIFATLRDLANCNTTNSGNGDGSPCSTSVQEVCWMTLQRHEYNQTIPGQEAVIADQEDMEDGITEHVQPIWRPNSKYYIHFRLKDSVDNGNSQGTYNYYYGFRTVGPVGHFHNHPDAHYIPTDEKAESYALSSLRNYIDYGRSYPNADSNMLKSKPLFYGNEQCKISLFFMYPYVYHMLRPWKAFEGLPEIIGSLNISIKDPVTNVVIPYPLPIDYDEEIIPVPIGAGEDDSIWIGDNDPRLPLEIQLLQEYVHHINETGAIQCELKLGEMITPEAYAYSVNVTNLKPQKLYTVIVYNAFDLNGNGVIDTGINPDPKLNENQQVHEFVFQTSRYENFEQQVQSYLLTSEIQVGEQMQAVYDIELDLTPENIDLAYDLVSAGENEIIEDLQDQYLDYFDRVIEGVFGMLPQDAATHTEFNRVIDINTRNVIAVLIRNPEPFNDPKIPLKEIVDMIAIPNITGGRSDYSYLYSKDYSQVIVMHADKRIKEEKLDFEFKYYQWDWDEISQMYRYVVKANSLASQIEINPA